MKPALRSTIQSRKRGLAERGRYQRSEANGELEKLTTKGDELASPLQRAVRNVMCNHCGTVGSGEGVRQAK